MHPHLIVWTHISRTIIAMQRLTFFFFLRRRRKRPTTHKFHVKVQSLRRCTCRFSFYFQSTQTIKTLTYWCCMWIHCFVYNWCMMNGKNLFDDWCMCMNGWCALRYNSIESMNWIGSVIDRSDWTVWFDKRILTYKIVQRMKKMN